MRRRHLTAKLEIDGRRVGGRILATLRRSRFENERTGWWRGPSTGKEVEEQEDAIRQDDVAGIIRVRRVKAREDPAGKQRRAVCHEKM